MQIQLSGTGAISPFAAGNALIGGKIVASVSANALTIAIKTFAGDDPSTASPVYVAFRSSDAASSAIQVRTLSAALSLVISSGSTLGTSNSTPFRVWLVIFDDAGTLRIGAIVCSTATVFFALDDGQLLSSTAEGGAGAADSAGVIYTGTAVSSKAFRILGYLTWNSGLATAGTWSAGPDVIQLFGPGIKKPGELVQSTANLSAATASGTTIFPCDTSIPQNNEGDEYFSTPLTPASPVNWIEHDILIYGNTVDAVAGVALFQDSGANAIAGVVLRFADAFGTAMVPVPIPLKHRQQALTASSTTFKIRAGSNAGGAGNAFVVNALYNYTGPVSQQLIGGIMRSGHIIREFQA